MSNSTAVFLVNLLQDVNISRPLIYLAARAMGLEVEVLVSEKFFERDRSGIWAREIIEICEELGLRYLLFSNEFEAFELLQGKRGVLIAASESNLPAHTITHNIMRLAPDGFVRVTLQHGFEGVGFLQSREHDLAHGTEVTFAADILCGWFPVERQTSMVWSQRPKLYVSGPPAVLQMPPRESDRSPPDEGLVCENLHSVRLNVAGDFKGDFVSTFGSFCDALAVDGRAVSLRPHPGGQYVVKNNVPLPSNVILNNDPIYRVDLSRYAYGISAPSSVLIDMMLAEIPVAVWRDGGGTIDAGNYAGLAEVSSAEEWVEFSRAAAARPQEFLERQRAFLARQMMPTNRDDVHRRFADLLRRAAISNSRPASKPALPRHSGTTDAEHRIVFVANDLIPTLQLSFLKPLQQDVERGTIVTNLVTEKEIRRRFPHDVADPAVEGWISAQLEKFRPTALVFCRYSGRNAASTVAWARRQGVPIIYHIDDDLLNVPVEIGIEKHKSHNEPARLEAVRFLLDNADLVYCSTEPLANRFRAFGVTTPIVVGEIYCSGSVMSPARDTSSRKIGYMGFDHAHDFQTVLPAIVMLLRNRPRISFELFGSIPRPAELDEFGDRVRIVPPVRDYSRFMETFASLQWDIGICPLAKTSFNLLKADTKWVEYTAVGAAVIAARDTVYENCCADDCGILADGDEEWYKALEHLIAHPIQREQMVRRAQEKLDTRYSTFRLREQVLTVIERARSLAHAEERILFASTAVGATLQLSFLRPLSSDDARQRFSYDVVTVQQLNERLHDEKFLVSTRDWMAAKLDRVAPSMLIFSRYNGPFVDDMLRWARHRGVPTVFHIDDDLTSVPIELGAAKSDAHNQPEKMAAVRQLLDEVDLVYASTERLRVRLLEAGAKAPIVAGDIYCSGAILAPATVRPIRKVGYMASADHAHNLKSILPAIVTYLRRHPDVSFELFGSIPQPPELDEFGERVRRAPPIKDYGNFLSEFARHEWDIGICPLTPIPFNLMKANTKWVEYTSVGAAVIASRATVYDACCADGCGILADTADEWLSALEELTLNPEARAAQVARAQQRLSNEFSMESLLEQVLRVMAQARTNATAARRSALTTEAAL